MREIYAEQLKKWKLPSKFDDILKSITKEVDREEREYITNKVNQVPLDQRIEFAKLQGLPSCEIDFLIEYSLDQTIKSRLTSVMSFDLVKLKAMAQYNENTNSIKVLEGIYGIKLDKAMKRRIEQLKELK